MLSSDDKKPQNKRITEEIQHFEQKIAKLLELHAAYVQKIEALMQENRALKDLLQTSKSSYCTHKDCRNSSLTTVNASARQELISQINDYIKKVDRCLTYFEET